MTGSTIPEAAAYSNEVTAQADVTALYDRIRTGAEEKKAGDEALSAFLAGYVDDMKVAVGEALTEQKNAPESPGSVCREYTVSGRHVKGRQGYAIFRARTGTYTLSASS